MAHGEPFHVAGFRRNDVHSWSVRFVQPEIGAALATVLSGER